MQFDPAHLTTQITAIGALGTASFGLVDATKAFWGGISRCGIANIKDAIRPFFGAEEGRERHEAGRHGPGGSGAAESALTYQGVLGTLRANWMNGTVLTDQKAIAKSLLKLRLTPDKAPRYAKQTDVPSKDLAEIAGLINEGKSLSTEQADVWGRFDMALTAILDEAYERADQRYRNSAKLLAAGFSIVIALICGWLVATNTDVNGVLIKKAAPYWGTAYMWLAVVAGALATPLAPIAKDLTSALAAGVDVMQKLQKKP